MNEFDSGSGEEVVPAGPGTFALSLLYSGELAGLSIDHPDLRKEAKAKGDRWFCSLGGEAHGPVMLRDAFKMLLDGYPEIALLHESNAEDPGAHWKPVAYRPLWSQPKIAMLWTIGFWIIAALVGWMILCLALPLWIEQPLSLAYWIAAMVWLPLACIPSEVRERVKDKFRKPKPPQDTSPEP